MKLAILLLVWCISTIPFLIADSAEVPNTTEETVTTTTVDVDYYDDDSSSSGEGSSSPDEGEFFINGNNGDKDYNDEYDEYSEDEESEGADSDADSVYGMDYFKNIFHGKKTAIAKPVNLTEQSNPDVAPMKPDANDQQGITSPYIVMVLLMLLFVFAYMAARNSATLRTMRRNVYRRTRNIFRRNNSGWNRVRFLPDNPPSYAEAMIQFQ